MITGQVPRVRYPAKDAGTGEADREHETSDVGGGTAAGGRTMLVKVPWAQPHSQFTTLFERFAVEV